MQIKSYPVQKLPFSELYKTYLTNYPRLEAFYETNPFDLEAIRERVERAPDSAGRNRITELLTRFNDRFDVSEATRNNIKRLGESQTLAIVTGQQLGIYGGPAFTAYKTLSTIHLAQRLEKTLNRPVVPVFWLADEDHDFDEVNSITLLDGNDVRNMSLPDIQNNLPPVSELVLPKDVHLIMQQAREMLLHTDFSEHLWKLLDFSYQPGYRFDRAFGCWISRLFSKYGLVLAGSNMIDIKQFTKDCFKTAISAADEIRQALGQQSSKLKKEFHQQVTLYDSNLFYLNETGRVKIVRNGEHWKTDTGHEWETCGLFEEIDRHPERFSPNVFLRPILQDKLLPTLGYVAGPGETAYYGQMKTMYGQFGLTMPVIFPRLSATIVEPAIERILNELPFEIHEYEQRIEDLEKAFVDRTDQVGIEELFGKWTNDVEQRATRYITEVADVDPTLEGAAGKATAIYLNELEKLKGKVYRAVKKREEIQLNRIRRIKAQLFPGGGLQERNVACIYYMNKYGVDLWDRILQNLGDEEMFGEHKLIYI